jgi:hypothetical protein
MDIYRHFSNAASPTRTGISAAHGLAAQRTISASGLGEGLRATHSLNSSSVSGAKVA